MNWGNIAAGSYSITARATDNLGAVSTSAPMLLTVNANNPPSVGLTSPDPGQNLIAPATSALAATASDAGHGERPGQHRPECQRG